ncbi:MAG: protein kinase [Planctomycetes bacterium]|nr:protein kinase [Planctomycetota bacterium]
MKASQWAQLKELLNQALEIDPEGRSAFLDEKCGDDSKLRQKLDELLEASKDLDDFMSPPKGHVIPIDQILESANEEGLLGTIGGFRLIHELGRGGRGVVYLAKPQDSDRLVALKVLSLTALPSAVSVERFQREARSVSKLEHPRIVQIQSLQHDLGRPFLVMDYVDGPSLAAEICALQPEAESEKPSLLKAKDGQLPETAARLIQALAEALAHAHERGVVHRDIKPQNILLDLVDFGLARDTDEVSLTRTGEVEGTPNYMSPEQVRAKREEVDHRTDIYSLGVVLYELLTLKRPFEAATANQVMANITSRAPQRVRKLNATIPRDLELVCMKAMEKNPAHRYASATEMAEDLGRFLKHQSVRATAPNWGQRIARHIARKPLPWVSSVAAILIIVAAVLVNDWVGQRSAFSDLESQMDGLELKIGIYEPVPSIASLISNWQAVQEKYGNATPELEKKFAVVQTYRTLAKEFLAKNYLEIQPVEVSNGYWLAKSIGEEELPAAEAYSRYLAGMSALGFSAEELFPFYQVRQPLLVIEPAPEIANGDLSVFTAYYLSETGKFSTWHEHGLFADLKDGISLDAKTPYRVLIRNAEGQFAECSVIAMPEGSKRVLKLGPKSLSERTGMISVEGIPYGWFESDQRGGPLEEVLQPDFMVDEYLVTFGQYRDFLTAAGYPMDKTWLEDEAFLMSINDRPVVYLTVSDMAAYAAWHGKRLITLPEHKIAVGGAGNPKFPSMVVPEIGHRTMPFGIPEPASFKVGEYPEEVGQFWYWVQKYFPDINNIPDFDRGLSGIRMVWGTIKQMTESSVYNQNAYAPHQWTIDTSFAKTPQEALDSGLRGGGVQWIEGTEFLTGFRCAISRNFSP